MLIQINQIIFLSTIQKNSLCPKPIGEGRMRVLKIVAKLHLGVEANKLELKSNHTPRFNRKLFLQTMLVLCGLQAIKL